MFYALHGLPSLDEAGYPPFRHRMTSCNLKTTAATIDSTVLTRHFDAAVSDTVIPSFTSLGRFGMMKHSGRVMSFNH